MAKVIAGCKSDVVGSNKHVNNQLVARTYSSTPNGKTQIPAPSVVFRSSVGILCRSNGSHTSIFESYC